MIRLLAPFSFFKNIFRPSKPIVAAQTQSPPPAALPQTVDPFPQNKLLVLKLIAEKGPLTSKQIFKVLNKQGPNKLIPSLSNLKHRVLKELKDDKMIKEHGYSKLHKSYLGLKTNNEVLADKLPTEVITSFNKSIQELHQQLNSEKLLKKQQVQRQQQIRKEKEMQSKSKKPKYLNKQQMAQKKSQRLKKKQAIQKPQQAVKQVQSS